MTENRHLSLRGCPQTAVAISSAESVGLNGSVGIIMYFNPSESSLKKMPEQMELLGQSEWGPVYFKAMNVETHWPDYQTRIIKALNIQ